LDSPGELMLEFVEDELLWSADEAEELEVPDPKEEDVPPCGLELELFVEFNVELSFGAEEDFSEALLSLAPDELEVYPPNDDEVPPCALEFKLLVSVDVWALALLLSTEPDTDASAGFWDFDAPLFNELSEVVEAEPDAELVDPKEDSPLVP